MARAFDSWWYRMGNTYEFGKFVLDPARRVLTRTSGDAVTIHSKAFDALMYLAQHSGDVVSRATLTDVLWPKAVVEDNNLSQTIRAVRLALGDTGTPYRYVATVQRRGYQFVAEVLERPAAPTPPAPVISLRWGRMARPFALACASAIVLTTVALFVSLDLQGQSGPSSSMNSLPDRITGPTAYAWPLPPAVACQSESARSAAPSQCAAVDKAARKLERRHKLGLRES
jgi:DNA-binding winged helix-turn-helix (wHTH) protein